MSLTPGSRLGPYEISAQIGAGGMGEVYRATDINLKRQVALKVLPDAVAADGDRLARFQREAEVLASLNHPNIAIIHGLEKSEGITALVMELVEGPTLADRIVDGPIQIEEALGIAKQIAEALEAAHEQGIVHRDLKPANVKVRPDGTVKVLDFGLAKAMGPPEGGHSAGDRSVRLQPELSMSPTLTTPAMTQVGMIMGTAAYMSPEQARGRALDKRSDIWAFGCVLFEMLTGTRAFDGDDVSETLASVLAREPDWNRLPSDVPAVVAIYLRRCLQKNPKARIADVQDLRLALTGAFDVGVPTRDTSTPREPTRPLWRRALPLVTTALVVAAAAASAAWFMRPADPRPVMRSIHLLPEGRTFRQLGAQVVAIAPDGRYFIYSGTGGLYVRSMDALEDRLIPGTTETAGGSRDVIVSPDGQSVAVFQPTFGGGALIRMPIAGGAKVKLTDTSFAFGGTWGEDGSILYAQSGGIWEVSENGGTPRRVITLKSDELAFRPQRLPGGDWILFTVTRALGGSRWDMADIVVESVGTGERRVLRRGGSDGRYLPGHLVYAYQDVLYGAVFDLNRLEVTGEIVPIVPGVRRVDAPGGNTGAAFFGVSTNGTLVYVPGTSSAAAGSTGLAWVAADGTRTALNLSQGRYAHPRLSSDGKWLAVERDSGAAVDIWIYETSGATEMRRLTNGGNNRYPVWSRDGEYVAFQSDREGNPGVFLQKFDGTGSAARLTTPDGKRSHIPEDWSPKEDLLAFSVLDGATGGTTHAELWLWSQSDRKATRFGTMQSASPFDAVFSPDGRWLAYSQRILAAGVNNVLTYVHSVASPEDRFQVGRDEDQVHHPLWSPNGRQLIYFPGGGAAVAVDVRTEPVAFGRPTALPGDGLPINVSPGTLLNHDMHPDGRFVTVADVEPPNAGARNRNAIVIVQNWFEELKRRVPR